MQKSNLNILSTRPLSTELINEAAAQNIKIECISFIETVPVESAALIKELEKLSRQNITAVFTSMNAVEAITKQVTSKPDWKIFCIGNTTRELVSKSFGEDSIEGVAENADALANVILTKGFEKVYFFCGNQRRDELPQKLRAHGTALIELVVYKTEETAQRVLKKFDGILFFSPSAVHSFFSVNTIALETILFAIGKTTSSALQTHTSNTIIIASSAGKENLVKEMIAYFSTQKN